MQQPIAANPTGNSPQSQRHTVTWARQTAKVVSIPIDVLSWYTAIARISGWAQAGESRVVCICNAHSVVTGAFDPEFAAAVRNADMATSDGTPVTWMLRQLGAPQQKRINGPDLMAKYCARFAARGAKVYLYGGMPETLDLLAERLCEDYPGLQVVGTYSPPFRALTDEERAEDARRINESGAEIVFVGLGCPKQELWMAAQRGSVKAVMVGVGAAFDYHAGTLERAPRWMQHNGLEWAYRLSREPGRLWKRYLTTNALFVLLAGRQWLVSRLTGVRPAAAPAVATGRDVRLGER